MLKYIKVVARYTIFHNFEVLINDQKNRTMATINFETATANEIREEIKTWHKSHYGSIQLEIAQNPAADTELLRQVFEIGQNFTADNKAMQHSNCPADLKNKISNRLSNYISAE